MISIVFNMVFLISLFMILGTSFSFQKILNIRFSLQFLNLTLPSRYDYLVIAWNYNTNRNNM